MKSGAVTAAVENNHTAPLTNIKSSKKKRKSHTKGESQRIAQNKVSDTVEKCSTANSVKSYHQEDSNDDTNVQSVNTKLEKSLHISNNGCKMDLLDDLKSKKNLNLLNNDLERAKNNDQPIIINKDESISKTRTDSSIELSKENGNLRNIYYSHHSDQKSNLGLCEHEEITLDRDNLYCHKITTVDSFDTSLLKTLNKSTDEIVTALSSKTLETSLSPISLDSKSTVAADKSLIDSKNVVIDYKVYESELQMPDIMRLIQAELSEPYSIYTYRYFIYNWPKLCFLAAHGTEYVGAIVCKLDMHRNVKRGYIAMLAVKQEYRKLKIGTTLVEKAIEAMLEDNAEEVVLETERKNIPALRLYENLGFVRDKRLFRYYLNGVDALRLKLWFR